MLCHQLKLPKMILVLLLLFSVCNIRVMAIHTKFPDVTGPNDKTESFITHFKIGLCETEPPKTGILCFDVNEMGMIAICQKNGDLKNVCIYSYEGDFLLGYSFQTSQSFATELNENSVNIYFYRSDIILSLDFEGNILGACEVGNTIDNNSYINHQLRSNNKEARGKTFQLRNSFGLLNYIMISYSQLIITDSDGNISSFYDIGSKKVFEVVFILIFVIAFMIVVLVMLINCIKRLSENYRYK